MTFCRLIVAFPIFNPTYGGHLGSAILDFLTFPRPSKTAKIDQEVIKINKLTRK